MNEENTVLCIDQYGNEIRKGDHVLYAICRYSGIFKQFGRGIVVGDTESCLKIQPADEDQVILKYKYSPRTIKI